MKRFYQNFSKILDETIQKVYNFKLEPPLWELPPKLDFGDLSSTAPLKLASRIKKNPLEIAGYLKLSLEKILGKDIEKIEIFKPGFINVFISKDTLISSLTELIRDKRKFFQQSFKRKILLEFVSANPTGPLSIAHGRQAVVGDVVANLLKFYGNTVKKEYYINDEGRQIKLLVESVEARIKELEGKDFKIPDNGYVGEYVKYIAKKYLEEKNKKENLEKFTISYILSWIKKDLSNLGVKFDNWVSQKKLIENGEIEKVITILKQKGLIYETEGALWFSSTKFGDDKDRVIRKSDGELTYFASDIAYHLNKLERNFSDLINFWGPDHHGYIERVKSAIEALGYNRNLLKVVIVQLVNLKTKEKMSKRKGTAILLSDLLNSIGKDATRFYYLMRGNSSHLEFDIELAKESTFNNPLYYIQYVSARIESIFRKTKLKKISIRSCKYLKTEDEINYLRTLLQFSNYLDKAYYTLEPLFIIEFLKKIAAEFHKFYEKNRILTNEDKTTSARLTLLEATRIILHCGLNLLGIKPLKKM